MNSSEQKIILKGQEAIDLWLQGKDAWNAWVEKHPIADVSFTEVDFSEEREKTKTGTISFDGFIFPEGNVYFVGSQFGDGKVTFSNTQFGDGDVSFRASQFGKGDVLFKEVQFGIGSITFADVQFDTGTLNFETNNFSHGNIDFRSLKFGNVDVILFNSQFGIGEISFESAQFGGGCVAFIYIQFNDGNINFDSTKFGGDFYIKDSVFGVGDITFSGAKFKEKANFMGVFFGTGKCDFQNTKFIDDLRFSNVKQIENVTQFNFRYASFERSVFLPETQFNCVLDLTNTKFSNQITLHKLECTLKRKAKYWWSGWFKKAIDPEDAARFRRLKEIAENNKDHERALAFHADEKRAKRWYEYGLLASLLDGVYSFVSNYGQSILRPTLGLILTIALFTSIHIYNTEGYQILNAFEFTLANSLPFLGSAKAIASESMKNLYTENIPSWVNISTFIQGGITFILLFFIGLGLRNRFRI